MFRQNDKLTLTLINARDIQGNILPFQLKLPLDNKYTLPEGIASLDVFEYHEGLINGGNIVFSIYIGEIKSINDFINTNTMSDVEILKNIRIPSLDSPLCVQNISGKKVAFATINEHDIVVKSQEELIEVIEQLSNNFNAMNNSIKKIHVLSKKKQKL